MPQCPLTRYTFFDRAYQNQEYCLHSGTTYSQSKTWCVDERGFRGMFSSCDVFSQTPLSATLVVNARKWLGG